MSRLVFNIPPSSHKCPEKEPLEQENVALPISLKLFEKNFMEKCEQVILEEVRSKERASELSDQLQTFDVYRKIGLLEKVGNVCLYVFALSLMSMVLGICWGAVTGSFSSLGLFLGSCVFLLLSVHIGSKASNRANVYKKQTEKPTFSTSKQDEELTLLLLDLSRHPFLNAHLKKVFVDIFEKMESGTLTSNGAEQFVSLLKILQEGYHLDQSKQELAQHLSS